MPGGETNLGAGKSRSELYMVDDVRTSGGNKSLVLKTIIGLLCLAIIALIVVIVVLSKTDVLNKTSSSSSSSSQAADGVCLTPECVKAAAQMGANMDMSVDPCDDFYQFACGGWLQQNPIPESAIAHDPIFALSTKLNNDLRKLLEAPMQSKEVEAVKQTKRFYQSCLNTTKIDELGTTPVTDLIQLLGGWPMINAPGSSATVAESARIEETLAKYQLYGGKLFFSSFVSTDDRNSSVNIIQVNEPTLGAGGRDFYLNPNFKPMLDAYTKYAQDVAIALNGDSATVLTDVTNIIDFETKLANLTTPAEDLRDQAALYNKITLIDLNNDFSNGFDWTLFYKTSFDGVNITLPTDEPILLKATQFLTKAMPLIQATPKRVLVNYLMWRLVMPNIGLLGSKFGPALEEYMKVTSGTSKLPRWENCVSSTNLLLGDAVGRLYVQKHFPASAKKESLIMIKKVRNAFNDLLKDVKWMDDNARAAAMDKANAMKENIGYPDHLLNDTALNKQYIEFQMNPAEYFKNNIIITKSSSSGNLKQLRTLVDKDIFPSAPAVVNAFYAPTLNSINFPAGIFQPPFYGIDYPKYLNYGGISMVIGHELTHGFDDTGRQFDKNGNLRQWWSDEVIANFKIKAQCIIEQYGNYSVPSVGLKLNGINTQGENIADSGGIKESFNAYRNWVKERGSEEKPLPGFSYNTNQLFFINNANLWCSAYRPQAYIQQISSGVHSPGEFRVLGPLSNFDEFAKTWNCPLGSKMNPVKKCLVW